MATARKITDGNTRCEQDPEERAEWDVVAHGRAEALCSGHAANLHGIDPDGAAYQDTEAWTPAERAAVAQIDGILTAVGDRPAVLQ